MKWRTQQGDVLDIKDMSENHLRNSIAMLKRHLEDRPAYVDGGDSDGAYWAAEHENRINEEIAEETESALRQMERELRSRTATPN